MGGGGKGILSSSAHVFLMGWGGPEPYRYVHMNGSGVVYIRVINHGFELLVIINE